MLRVKNQIPYYNMYTTVLSFARRIFSDKFILYFNTYSVVYKDSSITFFLRDKYYCHMKVKYS